MDNFQNYDSNINIPSSQTYKTNKHTPWHEFASELYRPSDRRFSAKLVPTAAGRGVSRIQRGGFSTAVISVF
jgi:hypothetical protein